MTRKFVKIEAELIEDGADSSHITDTAVSVWYQAMMNRYNSSNSANANIDTKSGVILAAAIAVGVFLAQIAKTPRLFYVLGAIGLVATVAYCLRNIHVKEMPTEVHLSEGRKDYYDGTDSALYWHLISDLEVAIQKVEEGNRKKGSLYKNAVYSFLVSSLLIIIGIYTPVLLNFTMETTEDSHARQHANSQTHTEPNTEHTKESN